VTRSARTTSDRERRAGRAFARLVSIMRTLRSAEGCPWDRKQTPKTLRPFLLEETYEAIDAIDRDDAEELRGELGDVLFQCVFQAQIASESGEFDIADSVQSVVEKLIRRHPHVFTPSGQPLSRARRRGKVRTPGQVLEQWERLKAQEKLAAGKRERLLSGIPRALPSLGRAYEIGTRVAAVGFDWPESTDVVDKIEEETRELREALGQSQRRAVEELGDLLFTIANLARKLGMDPESALREANDKFTARFEALEDRLAAQGRSVHGSNLQELEAAWQAIKDQKTARDRRSRSGRLPSPPSPPHRRSRSRSRRRDRS
jgi:MazG family protein